METFSALLALCQGNSPVTGEFLSQRPVTRSFDVFLDVRLNKRLSKHSLGWWFETSSRSVWRHCNVSMGMSFLTYYVASLPIQFNRLLPNHTHGTTVRILLNGIITTFISTYLFEGICLWQKVFTTTMLSIQQTYTTKVCTYLIRHILEAYKLYFVKNVDRFHCYFTASHKLQLNNDDISKCVHQPHSWRYKSIKYWSKFRTHVLYEWITCLYNSLSIQW